MEVELKSIRDGVVVHERRESTSGCQRIAMESGLQRKRAQFVRLLGVPAQLTGLRFILFPPLIVMAYELFGHREIPGWTARPALFPLVCVLTASVGVIACDLFRSSVVGVTLTVLCSIAILRTFKVHMPPALAVGFLPFVMTAPNIRYPISVGIGTVALTLCFCGRGYIRRLFTRIARRIGAVNEWQAKSQNEELQ